MLFAMTALFNLELEQFDVKMTFPHDEHEETIYIHQPKDFVVDGMKYHVCRLRRSLYG